MPMTLRGMREAQDAMRQAIAAHQPGGSLEHAVQWGTLRAQRYASMIAPRMSGTLAASIVPEMENKLTGIVYINPASYNPWTRGRPADYGPIVHESAPSKAFFARTVTEEGPMIGMTMHKIYRRGLP